MTPDAFHASHISRHRAKAGFSLLEILITISIIALVIGIGIPALNGARNEAILTQARGNVKTLNEAATRSRVKGIVGAGTFGSDKNAAIEWYQTQKLVPPNENILINEITYYFGQWSATKDIEGKLAFEGQWVDPAFNPTSPAAVASALASLPDQRGNPATYRLWIATLNAALDIPGSDSASIQTGLQNELLHATTGTADPLLGTVATNPGLAQADWSKVETYGLDFSNRDLSGTNLSGDQLSQAGSIFQNTNLQGLNLTEWDTSGKYLWNANLANSTITGSQLNSAAELQALNLSGTDLTGWAPTGLNLQGFNLQGSNLSTAQINAASNFADSNLSGINFSGTTLAGKVIDGANLSGALNLTPGQIASATLLQGNPINLSNTTITRQNLADALTAAGKPTLAAIALDTNNPYFTF
jgi:prepilin-type N-terminal cleavage/methylation domain-containing protein